MATEMATHSPVVVRPFRPEDQAATVAMFERSWKARGVSHLYKAYFSSAYTLSSLVALVCAALSGVGLCMALAAALVTSVWVWILFQERGYTSSCISGTVLCLCGISFALSNHGVLLVCLASVLLPAALHVRAQDNMVVRVSGAMARIHEAFMCASDGVSTFWVAIESDGTVRGTIGIQPWKPDSKGGIPQQGTAEIVRLSVEPLYQRRGIGKLLLRAVEEHCVAHGFARMALQVGNKQEAALALYRHHEVAFEFVAREPLRRHFWALDILTFVKPLTAAPRSKRTGTRTGALK